MDNMHLNSQQTFSQLVERLEYKSSPCFISDETTGEQVPVELDITWREAKDKLGVDAVYFVADAPVIYFKRFEAFDRRKIAELHRNVWSQSKTPLLFVVLPGEIRIYSGYEAPKQDKHEGGFEEPSRLDRELEPSYQKAEYLLWERLGIFARTAIESGSFWRKYSDSKYFRKTTRADQRLIANLRFIRRELIRDLSQRLIQIDEKLSEKQITERSVKYANSLIGRSIFALYLQHRGVLTAGSGGFFGERFGQQYTEYIDLLSSRKHAYEFFKFLQQRFNGDIFPLDEEEEYIVQEEHLYKLRMLFTVDSAKGDGRSRQLLFFWAYNFEFIPIELISAIYEEFLYAEENGEDGAHYTPPRLVNFVLDQVLPDGETNYAVSVLDPACGSGIFLVEAYRRLVERWSRMHKQKPSFPVLIDILLSSIFGVEIKQEALQVAAFSLYLALLDYLAAKTIWIDQDVHFPSLIKNGNLIAADFFDKKTHFAGRKFDLVVGNPPWESHLTPSAKMFLLESGRDVGDQQIAQAFLWRAPLFCHEQGQIALLCSSKNLLFNRSGPNVLFRKDFFRTVHVTKIFDFSPLRRYLFVNAIAPTVAVFYRPQPPDESAMIFYGAPKLTHLTRRLAELVIETNDLKQLPLQQVWESTDSMTDEVDDEEEKEEGDLVQESLFPEEKNGNLDARPLNIWKVALWGTSYDYILLQYLNKYPSLNKVISQNKWISKVGFNLNGPKEGKPASWLDNKPYLDPDDFRRYSIDKAKLKSMPGEGLYYGRGKLEQFKAPFILFKRTQKHRQIGAAFFDEDCAYSESFTCIAAPEKDRNLLKAITALLNSELAQYYFFLTSASWGVEREEIKASEMKTMPIPFSNVDNDMINHIASLIDKLIQNVHMSSDEQAQIEYRLNEYIYDCFKLSEQEKQHIRETIDYTIKFFHKPENSPALKGNVTLEMKRSYASAFMRSINFYMEAVDRKLTSTVYIEERSPLLAVKFELYMRDDEIADIQEEVPDPEMLRTLSDLDKMSIENVSGRLYHRRNFRIYQNEDNTLFLIKPAEPRYWTIGAALADAEETVAEFM